MIVVGMYAKVGLVCQVWVSLEISFLGNELSTGAFEGQTVLLRRKETHWQSVDGRLNVHRPTPGCSQQREGRRLAARGWQRLKDRIGKLTVW